MLCCCLKKCKSAFWFIFWFSSGANLLMLFLPLYTSQVLDRIIFSENISTLVMLTIITLFAFACSAMLETCRYLAMARISDWIDKAATPDLIMRSIRLTLIQSSASSGSVIRDLEVIKSFITSSSVFSLFDTPWSIIYLICIFKIHIFSGFIAIFGLTMLVSMVVWNELATKKILRETNEKTIQNINSIDFATRNAEVVEAMGMSEFIVSDWCKRNDQNRAMQIKAQNLSYIITGITKFIRSTLQISLIGMGALLVIKFNKTVGSIVATSILMSRALAPFDAVVYTWKFLNQAKISYRRLKSLILITPKKSQKITTIREPQGEIEFDRVVFIPYGRKEPSIKRISFVIEPGDVVGITGESASGKSTIAKLIVGVWKPTSGLVKLDGIDINTLNRENFGNYVGYLPQGVELFNTSIKANIARMRPDSNPEKVIRAAKIVGIHELILSLPNGYDTVIGNFGVTLSRGQKQLIGLARAFYGNVKLLVLDEPDANLDSNGEVCLVNAILSAKRQNATTIVVTHRLSLLLPILDKTVLISDGCIYADGLRNNKTFS